jgi:hypothetical protein
MKSKFLSLISVLFFITLTTTAQITIENNQISPNFVNFSGVLLIQTKPYNNALNNILKKRFTKFYKGEFEVLEEGDLESKTYDSKKYPFVIAFTSSGYTGGSGSADVLNTHLFKFVMTDRSNNKPYQTNANYPDNSIPSYSLMNKYAKVLEDLRGK